MTPFVTVMLPIRNEENYIKRCLSAIFAQDYPPDQMELLIIDGLSTDHTRGIVDQFVRENQRIQVRIFDNSAKIVASVLNIGIRNAKVEIIVRVDGHCEIAEDFIRSSVKHIMYEKSLNCVGGSIITI